jgi:4-hydroxy-tetrahydrodipicolinate reductase
MRDRIRVLVLGTGQMGSGIARLVYEKQGLELVGAFAKRSTRAGMDVGQAIGLGRALNISVSTDLQSVIEQTRPHIAIQTTSSKIEDARSEIELLVRHGVHVISIAEEMAYPAYSAPDFTEDIHWLAVAHDVAVLGTGINPGFIMDLLVIALSGVCADIRTITAKRINDLSAYGPTVLSSQGVGLSPEAFHTGLENGTVTGHYGFTESIQMIASSVGWEIEQIEENREPIISRVRRETPYVTIEPGQVAGCLHTAKAYQGGRPVITLIHPQQIAPHLEGIKTGDSIEIKGTPDIHLAGSPEIPGGDATIALAVNMIPRVLNAEPGVHTMRDLPVPAALLTDVRSFVRADRIVD